MKNHTFVMFLSAVFVGGCGSSNTDINPAPTDAQNDTAADSASTSDSLHETTTTDSATDSASDGVAESDAVSDTDAAPVTCLSTSGADGLDAYFTLMDAKKCVVAQYDVPTAPVMTLTWGRHGGPLGFETGVGSDVKVVRWKAPAATTGALTRTDDAHHVSSVPSGAFFGTQALDLPFFDWTAIAYTTAASASPGELLLMTTASSDAVARYDVNGFFSETVAGTSSGRLLYTGLSPISSSATTTNAGGLYFADSCGTATSSPRLTPAGDATCGAPALFKTWQAGTSGPVAVDSHDDVFAFLATFGANQELRAFHHAYAARGGAPTDGTTLVTMPGYTGEMAADGKAVFFQSNDPALPYPNTGLDVQAIAYTIDDTAKTVSAPAGATTLLKLKKAGTPVALLVDDTGRLWVGVAKATTGDAGPTSSIFFVLGDKS